MKAPVVIAAVIALIFAGPGFAAEKKKKGSKGGEYKGQPWVNSALRELEAAHEGVETGGSGIPKAIASLREAEEPLKRIAAAGAKGSTGELAFRYSVQALKDLERGTTEGVAVKIDKAITAVRQAGDARARLKQK